MSNGSEFVTLFQSAAGANPPIPWQYLYALAGRESRWNPRKVAGIHAAGPFSPSDLERHAVGLFQITKPVVKHFNKVFGTEHRKPDMLNPALNTRIAAWYLRHTVYRVMSIDWNNPREVALFTQAWNSGPYATTRVLTLLDDVRPLVPPTVDDVRERAIAIVAAGEPVLGLKAKSYRWLAQRETKWAKSVARDYARAVDIPFP